MAALCLVGCTAPNYLAVPTADPVAQQYRGLSPSIPSQAVVRIYSLSGVLVNVLTHNDPQGGGLLTWDLRNRNNQFVASGVYFYHVEAPDGQTKVGRFTVVNFAP